MTEEGAGGALAVGVVAAVLAAVALAGPLAVVLDARQRAAGAADAAALAAADTALGVVPGVPCERAGEVVAAAGTTLARCEQRGTIVRVEVEVPALGFAVPGVAVAGPPDG